MQPINITWIIVVCFIILVIMKVISFIRDINKTSEIKDTIRGIERKTHVMWHERQIIRCKEKLHCADDWETCKKYDDTPYIRCMYCYKTPQELGSK